MTRKIRPWWIPVPYFAILVAYLVPRLDIVAPYGLLSGFNPVDNAASNVTAVGTFEDLHLRRVPFPVSGHHPARRGLCDRPLASQASRLGRNRHGVQLVRAAGRSELRR